jgi:putative ABC transport system permease protein
MSTLTRKSWQDIRRRWARSLFTVATIASAVAGLGLFALPFLMDSAMADRIDQDRLHDIRLFTDDLVLTPDEAAGLRAVPGVEAIDFRTTYQTRLRIGDRREDVLLVGVEDFARQAVNVVQLEQGALPAEGEGLTDPQNRRSGRLRAGAGETLQVEDANGGLHPLRITGAGRTLEFSQVATDEEVVLYVPQSTVNALAGAGGFNSIDIRLSDPESAGPATLALQEWLTQHHPEVVFTNLPDSRPTGTWPGEEVFNNFATLFYVGGVLALVSAVALISNTMTTMVAEQRREIAIMKAIGGRRRQVALSFLRTAVMLAVAGSLLGALVGIPFSNWLAGVIGGEFLGIAPGWGIAWPIVIGSFAVGLVGTTLASIPALLRGTAIPVREGLQATTAASGDGISRVLRHVPLPTTAGIGLRNIARRKARAAGTAVQVGLAVGVALGLLALGVTVSSVTADTWDTMDWDFIVSQNSNVPLDDRAGEVIQGLDGVEKAHPILYNDLRVDGVQYESWGIPADGSLYTPDIESGRWLRPEDGESRAAVAVIGRALAATSGLKVGDILFAESARGPVELEIVGIDGVLMNNATTIFIPLSTFQELLGRTDTNAFWVASRSRDEAAIDSLAARAEDTLGAAGYPVSNEIHYVEKAANLAANNTLTGVLAVIGVPIVAIGLIGLVNLMTMNVIERTREIGVLRSLGARSRDIQGIFRSEALSVAVLGWLLAVPLGWIIGRILVEVVTSVFHFGSVPYSFPASYPPLALLPTLALSWLAILAPLRRASSLRPGDALRYE